jgi:Ni/Fe-hydrogenase 1 B-type cytochrome subunit
MAHSIIRRIYVWELPVRFYHWINAAAVMVLVGTGIIIGRPADHTGHG